jgi:hypothetical protein
MSITESTSETFFKNPPNLAFSSSSATQSSNLANLPNLTNPPNLASLSLSTTSISNNLEFNKNISNIKKFIENKYVKAVLYIILILYASVIAPKLPDWLIPYLENSIVKIVIVFIIGLLATQDPIAAIIATIGVTVTYLFISEKKFTDYITNIYNNVNYFDEKLY